MAGSLQGYQNSVLAGMGDPAAQQAMQKETPGFDMFANVKTDNVAGMDMLSPTERRTQQYDSNRLRAEALNKEVEIGLGSRIDNVMSDADKQRYLNSLTKNQYQQMLKYKNEGYGFMASKELLENQYKLSDPNATGIMKYKDYAGKDAYYNNNADTISSSLWDKYVANPIGGLARYWNETLGYGEDAQKGNMSFADKFANLTLGNIINGLDAYANAESRIMNTAESGVKALYDRVVKGYDTDFDFYDKDREEKLIDEVIDAAYGAGQSAMGAVGLLPGAAPFTAALSTKPGEVIGGLTLEGIAKGADLILDNTPLARQAYRYLSSDSQDKLTTGLAMVLIGKVAKGGKAKLDAKATPYLNAAKGIIKNGLEKGVDYAKAQAGFEEFSKVKGWTERADGTFVETENYNPGYRGRVAKEFWEGFKEGVKEKYNNPDGTTLSEFESTVQQGEIPGTEKTTSAGIGNKTTVDNTQQGGIVNTIGTSQLRQWNKMNKAQAVKFFNKYGTDYGNWMAQRGFNQSYDNNINALWDYAEYVQGQKADVLGTIRQRYNDPRVDDMLSDALAKAEYIKSPDLGKIESLALKNSQGGLTPQDVDWLRQWFGYNVPLRFDGTDVSGTIARNNNIYTAVREFLEEVADENGFPQLRDLNREIAATHHIIEATTRQYNSIATNDTVSLKDLVTLAGAMANPKAWPVVIMQQVIKIPSVQDAILKKLIKGKTTTERNQIKIDLDKIKKIQDEAEQRRMLEEWIAKWNLKVEEATKAMSNRLPENITQGGVVAGDRGIVSPNPSSPTYQEMGLGTIRETASPQYLLRAIVEQLKQSNLIKDLNTADAVNNILANLSPEAQAKLATISQKLASGQQLTAEEGRIIEKIADVIRQDQDTITDVQQPGLFDGLDNPEGTDINNTNLPTNPTNNGGITEGGNPGEGGDTGSAAPNSGGDGNTGIRGEDGNGLGESEGGSGEQSSSAFERGLSEVTDVDEYASIFKKLTGYDAYVDDFQTHKTYTNADNTALISVDDNGNIVEFVRPKGVDKDFGKELVFKAIKEGGNKLVAPSPSFVRNMEMFGFIPVARWNIGGNIKYGMVHNGDTVEMVEEKYGSYENKPDLGQVKEMEYREGKKYMNDVIRDTAGYNITDVDGWDGVKNWDNFNNKFKTNEEIKDYIKKKYGWIKNDAPSSQEDAYNRELAETREIFNGHIDTKDIGIWYFENQKAFQKYDKTGRNTTAVFHRSDASMHIGVSGGYTISHESWHGFDYKLGKELLGVDVLLSSLADRIIDLEDKGRIVRPEKAENKIAELIWEFVDIFRDAKKRGYNGYRTRYPNRKKSGLDWKYINKPTERFARLGEAFTKAVRGGETNNNKGEVFTKKMAVDIAKRLGKVDIARQNNELFDGTLNPIDDINEITVDIPGVGKVDKLIEFVKGE